MSCFVSADSPFSTSLPTSPSPPLKSVESNGNAKGWSPVADENNIGELKIRLLLVAIGSAVSPQGCAVRTHNFFTL